MVARPVGRERGGWCDPGLDPCRTGATPTAGHALPRSGLLSRRARSPAGCRPAAGYAIGLAVAAGAKRVLLLHHRPDRTDTELEKLAVGLLANQVPVTLATDGEVICL
jgi:hypothetical protein